MRKRNSCPFPVNSKRLPKDSQLAPLKSGLAKPTRGILFPQYILVNGGKSFLAVFLCLYFMITPAECQRDRWQQPERIMDSLYIQAEMVIGEAGAGEGYFTFKLSPRLGEHGKIYANDIDEDKLDELKKIMERDSITNIIPILGKIDDPCFPDSLLDMVIMMYVFHDLEKPVAFLQNTKSYLKPGAPVVIIDRDPEKYGRDYGHFLTRPEVEKLLGEGGYFIAKIMTFLPRDNIYIAYPR